MLKTKYETQKIKINPTHIGIFIILVIGVLFLFFLYIKSNNYAANNFLIEYINVTGANPKVKKELQDSLKELKGLKTSNIDIYKVKAKVMENSKIQGASVAKVNPNIIAIKVVEKNPLFIWQNDNDEFYVVNSEDKIIRKAKLDDYNNLILFKGGNLPIESSDDVRFYIYGSGNLVNKISNVTYNGYRWDLYLKNGIIIKLPEHKIKDTINFIIAMDKKYQLLERNIAYIDARIFGKLFIKKE